MINTACAVALGFFDGVHIAHQKIIQTAVDYAKQNNLTPVALTFDKSPLEILHPGTARYLTQNGEKMRLISALGAETEFLKTDKSLLDMSAGDFILEILLPGLQADYLPAALPILQAADGDAHLPGKWLLSQAERVSIFLNLSGLSIAQEAVIAVQQIVYGNFKDRCQLVRCGLVKSIEIAGLQIDICIAGDPRHPCHLLLH